MESHIHGFWLIYMMVLGHEDLFFLKICKSFIEGNKNIKKYAFIMNLFFLSEKDITQIVFYFLVQMKEGSLQTLQLHLHITQISQSLH